MIQWIIDQFEAAFWILVGAVMLAFIFGFGELVSGQLFEKKKEPSDRP